MFKWLTKDQETLEHKVDTLTCELASVCKQLELHKQQLLSLDHRLVNLEDKDFKVLIDSLHRWPKSDTDK